MGEDWEGGRFCTFVCQFGSYDPTRKLFCLYSWWTTSLIKTLLGKLWRPFPPVGHPKWCFSLGESHQIWPYIRLRIYNKLPRHLDERFTKPCTSLDQYQKCSHREIPRVVWTLWVPYPLSDVKPFIEIISSCGSRFAMEKSNSNRWKIPIDVQLPLFSWNKQTTENQSFRWMISFDIISAGSSFCRYPHLISALSGSRTRQNPPEKRMANLSPNYLGSWNHRKIHRYSIFWLLASKMILLLPASCARCADDKLLDGWIQRPKV